MVVRNFTPTARQFAGIAVVLALGLTAFLLSRARMPSPERMSALKFPEQLVYARSPDDIINGGVMFTPPKDSAKPVAAIWIHGWGVNFYSPTSLQVDSASFGTIGNAVDGRQIQVALKFIF